MVRFSLCVPTSGEGRAAGAGSRAQACAPAASAEIAPSGAVRAVVRISYGDLDVRDRTGALTLMNRIARAAGAVCGGGPDSPLGDDRGRFESCRLDAYGRAVIRLDPQVIAAVADTPAPNPPVTAR